MLNVAGGYLFGGESLPLHGMGGGDVSIGSVGAGMYCDGSGVESGITV